MFITFCERGTDLFFYFFWIACPKLFVIMFMFYGCFLWKLLLAKLTCFYLYNLHDLFLELSFLDPCLCCIRASTCVHWHSFAFIWASVMWFSLKVAFVLDLLLLFDCRSGLVNRFVPWFFLKPYLQNNDSHDFVNRPGGLKTFSSFPRAFFLNQAK